MNYVRHVLHGRADEVAVIHRLLTEARAGHSALLVVQGEAGSGKTALLDHIAADAADFTVLRCAGVESEANLPFAALHSLLHDFSDRLDILPSPQKAALHAAFGLADAPGVDRFLAGLATLTLLSEVASHRPLLCLIDDAQWLDRESLDALLFAGRRLGAEGLVLLVAARDDLAVDLTGAHLLPLAGLDASAAGALLAESAPGLAPAVRDRLIEETGGNPLALIELAAVVSDTAARDAATPTVAAGMSPAGRRVLDAFGAQLDRLTSANRQALLIAAAEDTGDLGVISAAMHQMGLELADFESAERAALVRVSTDTVVFRHPLIRSAVYRSATIAERNAVHRALAASSSSPENTDRRAWHLAAAAVGHDEVAAAELEAAALRADRRGGYAASAAAHERAAYLTADPVARGQRFAAAAHSARESGQLDRAEELAQRAAELVTDAATLARLARVRARVQFERGTPRHASEMLIDGAASIWQSSPEDACGMLIEAVRMAYFADEAPDLARAVAMIDAMPLPADHWLRPMLAATVTLAKMQSRSAEQIPPLGPVVRAIRPGLPGATVGNLPGHSVFLRMVIGDAYEALAQSDRMLGEARERGMIGGLPHILLTQAQAALATGRLNDALQAAEEGIRIAQDTEQEHSAANLCGVLALITATTGDERRCAALAEQAMSIGAQRHSANVGTAALALTVLDLGYGRYQAALARLEALPTRLRQHPAFAGQAAPEWVEAAARSGQPQRAAVALAVAEAAATDPDNPVARANLLRCRALLASDDDAESHFQAALRLHREINQPLSRARTELLYGEWLRRIRRRSEARPPLRSALREFELIGARSWAERARTELRAAGERVAAGLPDGDDAGLTPQELQVVRLAAAGLSNRDIGARLFLSPRTVGYHLYKAFPKLGVAGRHELTGLKLP
ncbi:AAA family ATPase [Mycobacterium sp. CVI_P3]|uniref:AAA family ATPase n=1 Tax=Mycobacterium pinniadriaticum TaxID=2994102 RepID=A0ABT3S8N3_9MYCO|nr:LuxR family transcriptional regulator [Mycobacterium pinniadriaticum]MCX2929434.1 AAA family ATPase [Mycobacterium pinniadriaticum]MCX2935858.1 AAA family ATPase [Mycobacterium pinniadriaticum]